MKITIINYLYKEKKLMGNKVSIWLQRLSHVSLFNIRLKILRTLLRREYNKYGKGLMEVNVDPTWIIG